MIIFDIPLDAPASEQHEALESALNEGYEIIGHSTFSIESRYGETNEFSGGISPMERYTLYKPFSAKEALSELVLTTIATIERGETSTNQRPMWRCTTDDGKKVNIFLNTDEKEKDNFHLFEAAGWGEKLQEMALYSTIDQDIQIAMKKAGKFWEVVLVRSYSPPNYPF